MTRVIHTGDTHIGYQQYNSPERRRDFLRAFEQVAEDAVSEDVDAVVHAGDLFHDRRPRLEDLKGAVAILDRLAEAAVPFLAVVGNHESKRDAQWLDLFSDLGLAVRLGREPVVIGGVAFYGLDFVPRSRRGDLEYEFESIPSEADHAVLVSHGLFEPFPHADWDTETVLEESTVEFDAVLLGDNHAADTATVDDTWVTYCGSTERASATERDGRGYNLVRFEDDVAITRRSLPETRPFVFVDVELGPDEGADDVRERVREHDMTDAVVHVTIDGGGDPVSPAEIESFATERGALVARATDRRESPEEPTSQVHFTDPDEAVRDRLRELGLSEAARDIDRTVRDGTVADANVRETVERRIRDALEDDVSKLEPAPDTETEGVETDEVGERPRDGDATDQRANVFDTGDRPRSVSGPGDETTEMPENTPEENDQEGYHSGKDDEGTADESAEDRSTDESRVDSDGQVSIGDFS